MTLKVKRGYKARPAPIHTRIIGTTRYQRLLADWPQQDANTARINGHRSAPANSPAVRIEYMNGRRAFRRVRDEDHARRIVRGSGIARTLRHRLPVKMVRSVACL
ncbi:MULTISPECIES: hypothetical protein [Paraburkholderia]|uniref:Uncharacterized protein n=1 Tax=Paraburkholderia madseniana TaxID=2599607 RepID=A0AAP5BMP9_9BURK|nr:MULTISPECIES: hypothetical protein [Paraburkholderia]MCX4151003.1 hypothetical protein [Paraburkholderia madseniana]MCX4176643.1 hypothetical protein [Paraburkholderia madseniana]MDN7153935.1 hypothetical protein [Paraburkholderia sp. WS6]MDQ6412817.1 hypothetical protein [Paraburkholderia madseniana]MDQ6464634.1 hypothetical protein [Paraburkholderia madseniana]